MRKLKFTLVAAILAGLFFVTSCKKTTTNNVISKDSVYYSPWITLNMTSSNHDSLYYMQMNASKITSKILSSGAVIGYIGYPGYPSTGDTTVTDLIYWNAAEILSPGSIEIDASGYQNDLSGLLFRYVIIPGSILQSTSLQNLTQQQLSHMSFTDVQSAINSAKGQSSGNSFHP